MKIRSLLLAPITLACLGALITGCGQSAAPKAVKVAAPQPKTTPVPNDLVAYATSVDPTLKTTIQSGDNLLVQLRQHDLEAVANACTLAGGNFVNFQTAFHLGYAPSAASSADTNATAGYKLILAATDECGMAADSHSSAQMNAAASDLRNGLWLLSRAESTVAPWYHSSL